MPARIKLRWWCGALLIGIGMWAALLWVLLGGYVMKTQLKQPDIQHCAVCSKGVMHTGMPLFYQLEIATMGINLDAVQRQHGLEMMMGRAAAVAYHMGPQEPMAEAMGDPTVLHICHQCAMDERTNVLRLLAACEEKDRS